MERAGSPNGRHDHSKVLIVDDNDDILHVLRLMFELEGYEVVGEAANGIEATVSAMKHQPDFIVLDYAMPRLDGEGAAEILRSSFQRPASSCSLPPSIANPTGLTPSLTRTASGRSSRS